MSRSRLKTGYFVLEGLNSFATVLYAYYLYFFMQKVFGFDNLANLTLASVTGFVCMVSAWWGGRFAQRAGYFTALKLGFGIMAASLLVGLWINSAAGHVCVMAVYIFGMCLTWPTLEAIVSEAESPAGLQRMVGIYNIVWAGTGAVAYFVGGAMLDQLGLKVMFYVPAAIHLAQLAGTWWLQKESLRLEAAARPGSFETTIAVTDTYRPSFAKSKTFLRLAWLANPLAYIAINTLIAVIPGLAREFGLTAMLAGFFCSLWCFARLAAFVGLWLWSGWHYRFRWLVAAYVVLIGSFAAILLVPNLLVLLDAQLFFGLAVGLLYYSSLFYSMDVGETKGEHGGIHEAVIGFGNFAGPAVGAASIYLMPKYPNSGALAVCGLLLVGFGALLTIWRRGSK